MKTDIPFSGFYESIHNSNIDWVIERITEDDRGNQLGNLYDKLDINYTPVFEEYAKSYTENFSEHFGIKLTFNKLSSPKYYNFETDRIFCDIEYSEVERMFWNTDRDILQKVIKDRFTSYDGFYSAYSNDLNEWPLLLKDWDLNHVGTLVRAYIKTKEIDFKDWELYSMEDANGNGHIDNWIFSNSTNASRIANIRDYLVKRQERKSA